MLALCPLFVSECIIYKFYITMKIIHFLTFVRITRKFLQKKKLILLPWIHINTVWVMFKQSVHGHPGYYTFLFMSVSNSFLTKSLNAKWTWYISYTLFTKGISIPTPTCFYVNERMTFRTNSILHRSAFTTHGPLGRLSSARNTKLGKKNTLS